MSKFYVVKRGRKIGIFTTWTECEKQVTGFSGAIHKSFKNRVDAEAYFGQIIRNESPKIIDIFDKNDFESNKEDRTKYYKAYVTSHDAVKIYTDGSHIGKNSENENFVGFGAWCEVYIDCNPNVNDHELKEFRLSGECNKSLLASYGIDHQNISNPTAEFLAVAEVLRRFVRKLHQFTKTGQEKDVTDFRFKHILFYCDYIGTQKWLDKEWKAKEDHIIKILSITLKWREIIESKGIQISFHHVKGHSGDRGNDKADKLAAMKDSIDDFDQLLSLKK
tara:strand:+ start:52257 stop:53087 length:831 start_codon:yes stop_codon:yes gene_type:complete